MPVNYADAVPELPLPIGVIKCALVIVQSPGRDPHQLGSPVVVDSDVPAPDSDKSDRQAIAADLPLFRACGRCEA